MGSTSQTFTIGELVDLQWRLGVAVKSSNCKNLSSPYVSLLIKVRDSDQKLQTRTMELTLPEFQDFAKNFTDMSKLMDSLSL